MTFATVGVGSTPPFAAGSATGPGTAATSTATRPGQRTLTQSELDAANLIIWDALLPSSCAAVMGEKGFFAAAHVANGSDCWIVSSCITISRHRR